MTRAVRAALILLIVILYTPNTSLAHFGLLHPSQDIVEDQTASTINILAAFCHPFERNGMDLEKPISFGLFLNGKRHDLTSTLEATKFFSHKAWKASYRIKRPGDHIFFMVPKPYWEDMEGKYIQHVTKVIVNGFGLENSWAKPVGLPQEIVPLTRPYGLWTGNTFCGRVLFDGKPMPNKDVEIEHLNERDATLRAPKEAFITQVIRTDSDGEFCYTVPYHGWWGFAALVEDEASGMKHLGKVVPLERGAVLWLKAVDIEVGE